VSLAALGFDAVDEQIYRFLAGRPGAAVAELRDALRIEAGAVTRALEGMAATGLVAHATDGSGRFVAAPPTVAIGALVNQQRDDLRRAEQSLAELAEVYRVAAGAQEAKDLIEVVSGVEAIRHRFDQVQRGARREVLAFVTADTLAVSREENVVEPEAVARGVTYRVVLERVILEQSGALDVVVGALGEGEDIRVSASLPMKFVIADRALGLVPLLNRGQPGAVLVHASGLLDALVALFEMVWNRSVPLRVGHGDATPGPDAAGVAGLDSKILTLLFAGLTDQAVATQLNVSIRTVARRMRHLMDVAGVETRLQLGCHASRVGWV